MRRVLALVCSLVVTACGVSQPTTATTTAAPQYLGQFRIDHGATVDATVVGGLSGISYDPDSGLYYIVSDDRSAKNAARFYTARIDLSDNGIDGVEFVATHPWRDRDGRPFPPLDVEARPPVVPPDPEGIAVDGTRKRLYWSNEGQRVTDAAEPLLLDPSVCIATLDGGYIGEFTMPPILTVSTQRTGPRRTRALEGITLTPGGRHLWAAMEGPVYDDGELPTEQHGALTRITRFDVETRTATAQFAYPLDSVAAGPGGDNGLTDLVAVDDHSFLTVERGYGTHVAVRVYRVDVADAEDVLARPSLAGAPVRTMTKTLLVDLADIVDPLDNIEGITLGPKLADGRQSVVMVSDDNFSHRQVTQFLAFAL
ncbi:esterase-like activity of phytase family protein [Mycolicibacterium sp. XJ1819]